MPDPQNDASTKGTRISEVSGDENHYQALHLAPQATTDDVKAAFRRMARQHHPDKGGSTAAFARVQAALEVLSDPKRRAVYDVQLQHAWMSSGTRAEFQAPGAEAALLRELERLGVACDPLTQLVVLCEMCRCPATKKCWTCGMDICAFCTRRQHAKGSVQLHWPLVDAPGHMVALLGKQEFERKRIEDAHKYELQLPGYRSQPELRVLRQFLEDVSAVMRTTTWSGGLGASPGTQPYDYRLARFYMWAQTPASVHIALYVPTGATGKALQVECGAGGLLRVQTAGEEYPVLLRQLAGAIDASQGAHTWATPDGRMVALRLPKRGVQQHWRRLFQGDSDGARGLQPPYRVVELEGEVVVEADVAWWVQEAEDVRVRVGPQGLALEVDGLLQVQRSYWRGVTQRRQEAAADTPIMMQQACWSVDAQDAPGVQRVTGTQKASGGAACGPRPNNVLSITLPRLPLTLDERMYKKGVRQDHLAAERQCMHGAGRHGRRFFADDEDEFGLEDVLQAAVFAEAGAVYVPRAPWEGALVFGAAAGRVVHDAADLSKGAQSHLQHMCSSGSSHEGAQRDVAVHKYLCACSAADAA